MGLRVSKYSAFPNTFSCDCFQPSFCIRYFSTIFCTFLLGRTLLDSGQLLLIFSEVWL